MVNEKIVDIYCAQPIGDQEITKVTIRIHESLPDMSCDEQGWEKKSRDRFAKEADALFGALCVSLPRGTIDALLVRLLDAKRSLMTVRDWTEPKESEAPDGTGNVQKA
jgi:hypothetical protein